MLITRSNASSPLPEPLMFPLTLAPCPDAGEVFSVFSVSDAAEDDDEA
jgi:hypothetical protein